MPTCIVNNPETPESAALRAAVEQDDPEFARMRHRARVEMLRRQAAALRVRADDLLREADLLDKACGAISSAV